MSIKVKVKADGRDAKKILAGQLPDASGSNYVSPSKLYVPAGAESGVPHGSERVPYKSRPDLAGGAADGQVMPVVIGAGKEGSPKTPVGDVTRQVAAEGIGYGYRPTSPEGPGPSYVGEGVDEVKPVTRDMNPVERCRQRNNRTRDIRTNLGRGKPGIITTEG